MKSIAKTLKTVAAGLAATALIPCGLLTAQAVDNNGEEYATVAGINCILDVNGSTLNAYENLAGNKNLLVVPVPAGAKVFAHCLNGEGEVPLTKDPKHVSVDFFANPTDITTFTAERQPAAAPEEKAAQPAREEKAAQPTKKAEAPKAISTNNTTKAASNDGKVAKAAPASKNGHVAAAKTKDSVKAAADATAHGTAGKAVSDEAPAPADDSQTVQSNHVDAADYAANNISAVDQMGGAGTLIGIIILGLVGAAGAISLTRSIILG